MHCAIAKERLSRTISWYSREQLLSVWSDFDKYSHHLSFYTERFTSNIRDGFSGFPYNFGTEAKKLVEKQRKVIETTLKTDLEANDAVLRSVKSKLNRLGSSF